MAMEEPHARRVACTKEAGKQDLAERRADFLLDEVVLQLSPQCQRLFLELDLRARDDVAETCALLCHEIVERRRRIVARRDGAGL